MLVSDMDAYRTQQDLSVSSSFNFSSLLVPLYFQEASPTNRWETLILQASIYQISGNTFIIPVLSHAFILEGIAVPRVMGVFDRPSLLWPIYGWGLWWRRSVDSKALWLPSYQNHMEGMWDQFSKGGTLKKPIRYGHCNFKDCGIWRPKYIADCRWMTY